MTERAVKNTWVEIGGIVLQKEERAPHLPDDTKQVPLSKDSCAMMRNKARKPKS